MSGLYFLTGFLGAGKTTVLKQMIRLLRTQRLRVIVNEFGQEGIDGALLRDIGAAVEEIDNGSIFCSCRLDRFEEALETAIADWPDLILVEASGLSDPTGVHKILGQERFAALHYLGGICVVDVPRFEKVFAAARPCRKQLSVCDLVLLNKCDLAARSQIEEVEAHIHSLYPDMTIHQTVYGKIEQAWLDGLKPRRNDEEGLRLKDVSLQRLLVRLSDAMTADQLRHFIAMFAEDTYRVKGIVRLADGIYLADCTGALISVERYTGDSAPGGLVILGGAGMPMRQSVQSAQKWYPNLVASVE